MFTKYLSFEGLRGIYSCVQGFCVCVALLLIDHVSLLVNESFDDYIAVELLEGDNRYDAGDYGLQVCFVSLF